jgi:agmatinase
MFELPVSARYIAAEGTWSAGDRVIFGAPYDCTASYRPGTRFGPDAIRAASDGLETYSPRLDSDLEDIGFADVGNIPATFGAASQALELVHAATAEILAGGGLPVMLGGEHSLTPAAVRAVIAEHGPVTVLQLDAHADLRQDYLGDPNSHACAMRRCLDAGAELVQVGIRSGPREEWAYMRENGTLVELAALEGRLNAVERPVYVTVDIDAFDPSLVGGTGTPEPGGVFWADFERFVDAIVGSSVQVVGFDVMELAPQLDPTGVSNVVAAKVVRELLLIEKSL